MKTFEIQEFGIDKLALAEREVPQPAVNEVLVKFHAVSLNYRDLMMINGWYNPKLKMPLVPFSDGAGEIAAVGENVSKWKVGDRVCPIFHQAWLEGDVEFKKTKAALGGDIDGCLREYGTFSEEGLVKIPEHLSYEEASTLPCAAVTAYHALFESGKLLSSDTVLLQGTGGVSIFALQMASHFGAKTIITSSSDKKLEERILGAGEIINYKENPDWDKVVLELTEKRGVDHVVEVGGAGTLQKSMNAARMGGHIAVIGVLTNKGDLAPVSILMKSLRLHGIFVGSRQMFEDMNRMFEQNRIKPVVDKVFAFSEVKEALNYMSSGSHFGKIVIRIS